jgi:hypothetical protein
VADGIPIASLARRTQRIRAPYRENVTVFYSLMPTRRLAGCAIVKRSDPRFSEYPALSAARSDWLDPTLPRRIAPCDPNVTRIMLDAVRFHYSSDPCVKLTAKECWAFFNDPKVIASDEEMAPLEAPSDEVHQSRSSA